MPIVSEVQIPFEFHRFIIGQRGRDVRKLMQDYDVNVSIPGAEEQSDIVKIRGPPANVARAKDAVMERLTQLEAEKEDRVCCLSFYFLSHSTFQDQSKIHFQQFRSLINNVTGG